MQTRAILNSSVAAMSSPTPQIFDPTLYDSLESYAEQMNAQLADKSAREIVEWAVNTFGAGAVLSSSFGIQSAVMLHLARSVNQEMPIIWIDTGYLPPETYQFAARLTKEMQLNLKVYQSVITPARMEALYGRLWEVETDEAHKQYGFIRKVEPMQRALKELDASALLVGVRADQTSHRENNMRVVNVYDGRLKICPILRWTKQDVDNYMAEHNLPYHPLEAQGYESVGDAHSSRPLTEADKGNERAGRFNGVVQECGLHIDINMKLEDLVVTENPLALPESDRALLTKAKAKQSIVIFTKPMCKYCLAAKDEFRQRHLEFEEFTVGTDVSIQSLQKIVGAPVKTVPQIFIQGKYIGGYTELCGYLQIPSRFV